MRWFNGMGLRWKLYSAFGAALLLLTIVGFIGWRNTTQFSADFTELYEDQVVMLGVLNGIEQGLYELRVAAVAYGISGSEAQAQFKADEPKWVAQVEDGIRTFGALQLSADEQAAFRDLREATPAYLEARRQVFALQAEGKTEEANTLRVGKAGQAFATAINATHRLVEIQQQDGKETSGRVTATASVSTKVLLGVIALAIALCAAVAFVLARAITQGAMAVQRVVTSLADNCATELARALGSMADGDLTVPVVPVTKPIDRYGGDEIGRTAAAANKLLAQVQAAIAGYEQARAGLARLVEQVQARAIDVAATSAELGSAAGQTGAAVSQVTSAIQSVAQGAQETSHAAQSSNDAMSQLAGVVDGVARGASEQARQAQVASDTATRMAGGVERVAVNATNVAASSEQARTAAQHGATAVRETVDGMAQIQQVVATAVTKVEELGQLGERIGAVVEPIADFAEQTNRL
ncbi:MAG: MCP four helix bundle domain-containing protein, partial [Dehalococcoidia bacterium]